MEHSETPTNQTRLIECSEPWFGLIRDGKKPVEGRKASPTWRDVCPGERLLFRDPKDPKKRFEATVVSVAKYLGPSALRAYLEGETLARALPGVETYEDGEAVYLGFPGWTREAVEEHGMIAIRVRVGP